MPQPAPHWTPHEHKCGSCDTIINSAKAVRTCFGKHEEVCHAYHRTMHVLGETDKCRACKKTTQMRLSRLHDIEKLAERLTRSAGKDRKKLASQLEKAVLQHKDKEFNEAVETAKRKAGYFHWISPHRHIM